MLPVILTLGNNMLLLQYSYNTRVALEASLFSSQVQRHVYNPVKHVMEQFRKNVSGV